jgi:hypothetical protein
MSTIIAATTISVLVNCEKGLKMQSEMVTLKRINNAYQALNNSQSKWAKEYWNGVVSELKKKLN